jgi:hypothetical protein
MTYLVDVLITGDPWTRQATDWRRYAVAAGDGVEAELVACQMAYAIHGDAVGSVVVDWPGA